MPIALFKRTRGITALTRKGGGDLAATPLNPPNQSREGYHRQDMGGSIKQRCKTPLRRAQELAGLFRPI